MAAPPDPINNPDILRLVALARVQGQMGDASAEKVLARVLEEIPDVTHEDLDVFRRIIEARLILRALTRVALEQLHALLEPFGFVNGGASLGEAVKAIPDDWTERPAFDAILVVCGRFKWAADLLTDIGRLTDDEMPEQAEMTLDRLTFDPPGGAP